MHISFNASPLGTRLDGRYRLDRLIGEGASAWVFAAHDERLDRSIAVKLFKPRRAGLDWQRGFVVEGRVLARLVHPHVVLVHDAGETGDGLAYLVMELSEAGTLESELFRRGVLPATEALQLLLPLLGALAWAHDHGIIHRDLKPANVVLVRGADGPRAKLLDFGIARHADSGTRSASGTPSYMAPEQARGERATPAVDVWALGVVFFQCLSGRLPFEATNSLDGLQRLLNERAPLFAEACPELHPQLALALDRALERDVERRYPDMRSFARALIVSCAQDGIALGPRIEPLGLPDGDVWYGNADRERTRRLEPAERAAIAVTPVRSVPARKSTLRVGRAAFAVVALAMVGAWAVSSSKEIVRSGTAPRATRPNTSLPPAMPVGATGFTSLNGTTSIRNGAPQAELARPGVATPSAAVPKPRRTRMIATPRARDRDVPSLESEPRTSVESKSGVIKNWDW